MSRLRHRLELSVALAKAEFIERNEGSYLGVIWYLLNPLLLFALLLLVFSDRVGNEIPEYPLYLLIGIILFNFFQRATIDATRVLRSNRYLIKSVNFSRTALANAIVLKTLFSHLFEMLVFMAFVIFFKGSLAGLAMYPVILFFFYCFTLGASLLLAAITVYITDLEPVWAFATRLLWLGTPIFYAIGGQVRLGVISKFNPMYYFITVTRDIIVYSRLPEAWMAVGVMGFGVASLVVGILVFNKLKRKFAELM